MKFAVLRKSLAYGFPTFGFALAISAVSAAGASYQEALPWNADAFAHKIVSGLWPAERQVETAVLDLDGDGIGEILVRFSDRCVPPEVENSPPYCAYGLIWHDGVNWKQIEEAPARDVSLYRSQEFSLLAFDGLGVRLVGGATQVVPDFVYP